MRPLPPKISNLTTAELAQIYQEVTSHVGLIFTARFGTYRFFMSNNPYVLRP